MPNNAKPVTALAYTVCLEKQQNLSQVATIEAHDLMRSPKKRCSVAKNGAENRISPRSHGPARVQKWTCSLKQLCSFQAGTVDLCYKQSSRVLITHSIGITWCEEKSKQTLFPELFWQTHEKERISFQQSAYIHVCRKALNKNLLISQLSTMMKVRENVSSQPSLSQWLCRTCEYSLFITENSHVSTPSGAPSAKYSTRNV